MMITTFRVVLDACVLVPITLCDTLLSLADRRLFVPQWSCDILTETERALVRLLGNTLTQEEARAAAAYRRTAMEEAYPHAMIDDYQALIPKMVNHTKDRHVLAAAVRGRADQIVTANKKDFPDESARPYGIEIKDPDEFLMDILGFDSELVINAIRDMTVQKKRPPMTELEMLQRLAKAAPNFAAAVLLLIEA